MNKEKSISLFIDRFLSSQIFWVVSLVEEASYMPSVTLYDGNESDQLIYHVSKPSVLQPVLDMIQTGMQDQDIVSVAHVSSTDQRLDASTPSQVPGLLED